MKLKTIFLWICIIPLVAVAQNKISPGAVLENKNNLKMERLIAGDDSVFYAYRKNPAGTAIFIEKYNKSNLTRLYSKEITYADGLNDQVVSILYAAGTIYILKSHYNDNTQFTELYYQAVSSAGVVTETHKPIITIKNVYIVYTISYQAAQNRIFIKASYEPYEANDYISELYLFEPKDKLTKVWEKKMRSERPGKGAKVRHLEESLVAMEEVSDKSGTDMDKSYHFYFMFSNADKSEGLFYTYQLYMLSGQLTSERMLQFEFDGNYLISSVKFSRTKNNELIIAGVLKNIEGSRANTGFFCYILNQKNDNFISKTVKFIDEPLLLRIDPNVDNAPRYQYAFDYLLNNGSDIYLVAQQFVNIFAPAPVVDDDTPHAPEATSFFSKLHPTTPVAATTNKIKYLYRDILVVKFNSKGGFEWISDIPYRNSFEAKILEPYKQIYATATAQNVNVFYNDDPANASLYANPNFDPSAIKNIHESNSPQFTHAAVNTKTGAIKHINLFKSSEHEKEILSEGLIDYEFYTVSGKDELLLYTGNKGSDQFIKIHLE